MKRENDVIPANIPYNETVSDEIILFECFGSCYLFCFCRKRRTASTSSEIHTFAFHFTSSQNWLHGPLHRTIQTYILIRSLCVFSFSFAVHPIQTFHLRSNVSSANFYTFGPRETWTAYMRWTNIWMSSSQRARVLLIQLLILLYTIHITLCCVFVISICMS